MLTTDWRERLTLPVIAAPMTAVSGPELVVAACRSGVVGAFPTHNAGSVEELDQWLSRIRQGTAGAGGGTAPFAPNLVVHASNRRRDADVECLISHGVELVITSVGSPKPVVSRLHSAGVRVLADVASMRHVDRAVDAGVDGLVLLAAGAGGQTGSANPFAFVRAVRERFDGTIVLAGGIGDGLSILAAQVLGADLVYLGTRLISTRESLASDAYRAALIEAGLDDIRLSTRVAGLPTNLLASWVDRAEDATEEWTPSFEQDRLLRHEPIWSAGHAVGSVRRVDPVRRVLDGIAHEYQAARKRFGCADRTTTSQYTERTES
jgi:nitronate monooxygenase